MTNSEIVKMIANDPVVIRSMTQTKPDGSPQPPTPDELKSRAQWSLDTLLSTLVMDQSIARVILERSKTITTTSGTSEYTMDSDVSRIVSIKAGSNGEPLRQFASRSDFDSWYFETFGVASIDASYPPMAFYRSGFSDTKAIKITFSPGVGNETSMTLTYVMRVATPTVESTFPPEVHGAISVAAREFAAGKYTSVDVDVFVSRMVRALEPIVGGVEKIKPDDRVRRIIRRANWDASGGGQSAFAWPPKSTS